MTTIWSCPDCAAWQVDIDGGPRDWEQIAQLESVLEEHFITCGTIRPYEAQGS